MSRLWQCCHAIQERICTSYKPARRSSFNRWKFFSRGTNFKLRLLNRIVNDVESLKVGFVANFAAGRLRRQDFGLLLEGTVELLWPSAFGPPGDFHCAFCVFLT